MAKRKARWLTTAIMMIVFGIGVVVTATAVWIWQSGSHDPRGVISLVEDVQLNLTQQHTSHNETQELSSLDYSFYELLDSPVDSRALPTISLPANPEIARKKAERKRQRQRARLRAKKRLAEQKAALEQEQGVAELEINVEKNESTDQLTL